MTSKIRARPANECEVWALEQLRALGITTEAGALRVIRCIRQFGRGRFKPQDCPPPELSFELPPPPEAVALMRLRQTDPKAYRDVLMQCVKEVATHNTRKGRRLARMLAKDGLG
jgi:hypothetical protein